MLVTMKLLCLHMWPNEVKNVDDLRLDIALRMLKSPHFNAKNELLERGLYLYQFIVNCVFSSLISLFVISCGGV